MQDEEKRNLRVIENMDISEKTEGKDVEKHVSRQTNPIAKKLLKYQKEKEKFSVRDLFRR